MSWIKRIGSAIGKGWTYTIGPINPNSEKFNVRTRFKMALLSFFLLATVFLISFRESILSEDIERTQAFLDFAQHISYVLGAVVASFVGMESVFPSIGGYGWRGRGPSAYGGFGGHRKAKADDPPVGPNSEDAQVD